MRVLVTGAAGFIGTHLVRTLLAAERLDGRPLTELVLTDVVAPAPLPRPGPLQPRIVTGDFRDDAFRRRLLERGIDSVFHLAAMLTSEAERDVRGGLAFNLVALLQFLEECAAQARPVKFVFPSSIATFGGPLPDTVGDAVAQTPQTSYGTQKAVAELLINDYTRHGFVDGRSLRLPFVVIRPVPSFSVSDRVAGTLREPLGGEDVAVPLRPETRVPLASGQSVARALLRLHDLPGDAFAHTRAMNLPSLTVSIAEMVAALDPFRLQRKIGHIRWEHDPALQAVVDSWPKRFVSETASRHGIEADPSLGAVIEAFLAEEAAAPRRNPV